MSNAKDRLRAARDARWATIRQRLAVVRDAFPDINQHLAGEVACADRLWGPDGLWREAAARPVAPCQLSCCKPTD